MSIVEKGSLETINSLPQAALISKLVAGQIEHPVATTKFEAIDKNIKHKL